MLSQRNIRNIRALHRKKGRTQSGKFLVEGKKPVLELLNSGYRVIELISTREVAADIPDELKNKAENVLETEEEKIRKCTTQTSPEGIIAVAEQAPVSQDLQALSKNSPILAFHNLSDPGNLGNIIRSADHFGVEAILLSKESVDIYNPKVVRATMGALFRMKVFYVDLVASINTFRKNGRPVLAASGEGRNIYAEPVPPAPMILLGNEAHGLSEELMGSCDETVRIPKLGNSESLNVGTATAIFLSETLRSTLAKEA